jgi:hypothetical protein
MIKENPLLSANKYFFNVLLSIGARVRLLHSKEKGVVSAIIDGNTVSVLLDESGLEIPVCVEDLARQEPTPQGDLPKRSRSPAGEAPSSGAPSSIPDTPKHTGVTLAFQPSEGPMRDENQYQLLLVNDTSFALLFLFTLRLRNAKARERRGQIEADAFQLVGELAFEELNDAPQLELECRPRTVWGSGPPLTRKWRLKPKFFLKAMEQAPLLHAPAYLYEVFTAKQFEQHRPQTEESLRSYTQRMANVKGPSGAPAPEWPHEVLEFAEFLPELDLHIDKLHERWQTLRPNEILPLQLRALDAYISQALRLGVERVFIIHGVGEGRLRAAIARRLSEREEVARFKNEYHPRYGWGATEVIFKS